ncbi:TPM domain-containing protein [Kordia jejudonensis]|uniref:TPM domain-containing protein n=1 Tax=Kordia jejudonensis TaxID=1348245 RepID=UPI00062933DA|nr:TPM domain-containing protein [Kordia jejudonensis]
MRIISKIHTRFLFVLLGIFFLNVAHAQYTIPPKPADKDQKFVYDYANLLPIDDNAYLKAKLTHYADSTSTQIVVVIIESLKGESIGMLTPEWGHKWGIGQAEKDNGVIILLAQKERRIWISPGYGAENKLTAGITGQIVRNRIIPHFKRNDYTSGLDAGIESIFEVLRGEFKNTRKRDRSNSNSDGIPAGVVFFLIIFFIILISILANNKRNGGGGNHGGGRRSTGSDLLDIIILSNMGRGSFGSGSGSSGGFGGGGFGGGGFGGGGFSGGGAGGSW